MVDNESGVNYHGAKAKINISSTSDNIAQSTDKDKESKKETLRRQLYEKIKADTHPLLKNYVDTSLDDFFNSELKKAGKSSWERHRWETADRLIKAIENLPIHNFQNMKNNALSVKDAFKSVIILQMN